MIIQKYELEPSEADELELAYFDTPSKKRVPLTDVEKCFENLLRNSLSGEDLEKALLELKNRLKDFR